LHSAQLKLRAAHQHTKNGRVATAPRGLFTWCDDSRFGRNKSGAMQIFGVLHSEAKQQAAQRQPRKARAFRSSKGLLICAVKKKAVDLAERKKTAMIGGFLL